MKERKKWLMYAEIQRYKEMGLKVTQIARNLNITRTTVYKYLELTPEEVLALNEGNRKKKLDEYEEIILEWLETFPDLSAAQIKDWLLDNYEYNDACESTIRNYVRSLRKTHNIPKEAAPRSYEAIVDPPMGKQGQVDFGEKKFIDQYGKTVKKWFIAFVLSHGRQKYVEWSDKPFTTSSTIEAHENAFKYFEGMPEELVYDQDRLVLVNENYGDLILTYEFAAYQKEKGFKIHMLRKGDPESKGRIENVVGFVKDNFAKHRTFYSIEKLNEDCLAWLERTGNGKVNETTKKIPAEVHQVEKQYLQPAGKNFIINCNSSITALIRKNNTVLYKSNRYSLPFGTYDGTTRYAQLERDGEVLIIKDETGEEITRHKLCYGKGELIKNNNHERDRSRGIKDYKKTVENMLGGGEKAKEFLSNIHKEKPRHIRDQLQLIKQLIEAQDITVIKKALNYCQKYRLYSASCFKDAVSHFQKDEPTIEESSPIKPLNEDSINLRTMPQVRDLKVYQNIALERYHEH